MTHKNSNIYFILFYFLYCIKSLIYSLDLDSYALIDHLLSIFNAILLLLSIVALLIIRVKAAKVMLLFLLLMFSYQFFFKGHKDYFSYIISIAILSLAIEIKWKKLITIIFYTYLLTIAIWVVLALFADNYYHLDDRFGNRLTAGFNNPNPLALYLITLYSIAVMYSETLKIKKGVLASIILIGYAIVSPLIYLSFSRTGMIMINLLFMFYLLSIIPHHSRNYLHRKYLNTSCILLIILILISQLYTTITFNITDNIKDINVLLSGRIGYSARIYLEYGFGDPFGIDIQNFLPLDFYFINQIYSIGFITFTILGFIVLRRILKSQTTLLMQATLLLFIFYMLTENYFSVLFYSIPLFILFHKNTYQDS